MDQATHCHCPACRKNDGTECIYHSLPAVDPLNRYAPLPFVGGCPVCEAGTSAGTVRDYNPDTDRIIEP